MKFKDLPLGLFRFHGIVYTKFDTTKAVLIVSGEVVEFAPDTEVQLY